MRVVVPLLLVAVMALALLASRIMSGGRRAGPVGPPAGGGDRRLPGPARPEPETTRNSELDDMLTRWVRGGLISEAQAAAIRGSEHADAGVALVGAMPTVAAEGGISRVAEGLGYLGGVLAGSGLVLIAANYWSEISMAGRLGASGGVAAVLVSAGASISPRPGALDRLRGFTWFVAAAAAGLSAGVVAVDMLDVSSGEGIALAAALGVGVLSTWLWRWRDGPLQQLGATGALPAAVWSFVALFAGPGPVGVAVWVTGVCLVALATLVGGKRSWLTVVIGAASAAVGAAVTAESWEGPGWLFTLATAVCLVLMAAVPGIVSRPVDRTLIAVVGLVAMLQATPVTLTFYAQEAGVLTGAATSVGGALVVLLGIRRLVVMPQIAEVLGSAILLGGAALTGIQSPGMASLFGIATAVGLIGLGLLPDRVLLSAIGSIGLLVNVPWAIVWFFPGEGRAPLLILVSGVLIVAVAFMLSRLTDRFRRLSGRGRGGRAGGFHPPASPLHP